MSATDIVGVWEVAINGRPYKAYQELHQRRFTDLIRQQADTAEEPTERSLNPEDLWRRSQDDWVLGSGQSFYDDRESARKRYHDSRGVTPWERGEISLLPDVSRIDSLSGTIGKAVLAQGSIWVNRGNRLGVYDLDSGSWSETSTVDHTIRDIATDGTNVYIAQRNDAATDGTVEVISEGSTTPATLNDVIPDRVAYERGRLMVSAAWAIFNIMDVSTTDSPPSLTAAAINEHWEWTAFGSGMANIYVAGHSDQLSMIYRISIREDGTALTAPVAATQMPDGEFVTAISSYMGVILLGTTRGLRIALPQGGSLQYGPAIETDKPVQAMEGQGRFVWFGGDGALHRADLSRFLPPPMNLAPASAPDVEAPTSGAVTSIFTIDDRPLFVVEDSGIYHQDASGYIDDGWLTSGKISFGLADPKQFLYLDASAEIQGDDTVEVDLAVDGSAFSHIGTLNATTPTESFEIEETGERAEVRLRLISADGSTTPVVTRFTLRALPVPRRTESIQVVLDLSRSLVALNGSVNFRDVWAEFTSLQDLVRSGEPVTYQEFDRSWRASVENVQWGPQLQVDKDSTVWEGPCQVTLKVYE